MSSLSILQCTVKSANFVSNTSDYVSKKWAIDGEYAPGRMPILMLY